MKYVLFKFVAAVLIICMSVMSAKLLFQKNESEESRLKIVCTTGMIADVVRVLVGERAAVHCLMGPGVDPHMYRARAGDVQRLWCADIIFCNGLHLEGKIVDLFTEMVKQNKSIVAVGQSLDQSLLLKADDHDMFDPHIWHDVILWQEVVRTIQKELCQIVVNQPLAELFVAEIAERASVYLEQLDELNQYIIEQIGRIPENKRSLVTAHDAFRYFGKRYGVTVVGLQGVSTNAQVGLYDMQQVANYIIEYEIKTIFVESCVPHHMMVILQEALGARGWSVRIGKELFADALGDVGSGCDTYITMMQHNVDALVEGLL
jgi:manganese/zinc/iron transport system substrate-binding protein